MPLRKENTRFFHRTLFGPGVSKTVTLLKRNDDQQAGTVTSYKLFYCLHHATTKTGEPIQGDMSSDHSCTWLIPQAELNRVGVSYINAADRIVEYADDYVFDKTLPQKWWQPESTTKISNDLFRNYIKVDCLRIDPPNATTLAGM